MKSTLLGVILVLLSAYSTAQQRKLDVNKIQLEWEVVENHYNNEYKFLSAFTLLNKNAEPLKETGWSIYFNFVRSVVPESVTSDVIIEHVNGDLYRLRPASGFRPLKRGESVRIEFVSSDWVVNFTDAPAGPYLVWDEKPSTGIAITQYSVRPSTEPKQYLRFQGDKIGLITPAIIYAQNEATNDIGMKDLVKIFPTPHSYAEGAGLFMITEATIIESDPSFENDAEFLSEEIYFFLGKRLLRSGRRNDPRNKIYLIREEMKEEAYRLSIDPSRIEIAAGSAAGIYYGIQSLKSLIPFINYQSIQRFIAVPSVEVLDEPRFSHRAFFLDVARNFQSKDQILKLLDVMGLYKLNVLHLHLNDDEGWRLEIPGLAELTEVGSRRGHGATEEEFLQPSFGSGPDINNAYGSGYYSRSDFIEILKYARRRSISVIPEIETPGHARAAVKAMNARYKRLMKAGKPEEAERFLLYHPEDKSIYKSVQGWNDNVMDPGLPSTYMFLEKVVDEIIRMYKDADAPLTLIHMGGDEVPAGVWEKSPACNALIAADHSLKNADDLWYYFFDRVGRLVNSKGLRLYGWEEIAMRKTMLDGKPHYLPNPDFVNADVQVDVWNNVLGWGAEDLAYRLANAGYKVVLSCVSHLYFDMAYHKAFDEPGYYWGAFVDVDKPFLFIPFDYFRNADEDRLGNPLDRSIFKGKQRLTEYGKGNIVGLQGLLWAENILGGERMEYMMLPKLLGLAERAWAAEPDWSAAPDDEARERMYSNAWSHFANTLGKRELPRLDHYHRGYRYRIPAPGAIVENQTVKVNIQFPGLEVKYTSDGKEPTMKSKTYTSPIADKGTIRLKAFSTSGRGSKTIRVENP
jgi:hexosaminidase